MYSYAYDIVLQTRIGDRKGSLALLISDGRIDGLMHILGKDSRCQGVLKDPDICELSGQLKTVVRSIDFSAYGKLTRENISLTLMAGRDTFRMVGTARPQEATANP